MTSGNDRIGALFHELCARETADARRLYYLGHPILASRPIVDHLSSLVASGRIGVEDASARQALDELRAFLDEVSPGPESYPLGPGPIEQIWKQVWSGELREDRGLALAAEPHTADLLSEQYAHAVGFYCAARATQGNWQPARLLHRLLLAAARACQTADARAVRIRAEREWLVTACAVLMHAADGRVYREALAGGEWLIRTLEEGGEQQLLGESIYYLGVLHLDPYAALRNPSSHALEERMWLTRTAEELGFDAIEGIPTTREALSLAERYLRRATELATGKYSGYARKALLQTLEWQRILGENVADDQQRVRFTEALAALDPTEDPGRWLRTALALQELGGELDEEKVAALLSVSLDEWILRKGPQMTAEILPPLLLLLGKRDPWAGLSFALQASELIAGLPNEQQRIGLLRHELALFGNIAERQKVDPTDREEALPSLMTSGADPEVIAACLVAFAVQTLNEDEEVVGLIILDHAEKLAPALAQRHRRVFGYLRATLLLGVGSNASKAAPPRTAEAVIGYGKALALYLELHLLEHTLEMWARIGDLARRRDLESANPILGLLLELSLQSELAIGEPAAAVVGAICRQLTITLTDNAETLPILWQVAKGQRWAATLIGGVIAPPGSHEYAKKILQNIADARRRLRPADVAAERPTSGSARFETWLSSYVRTERYDGDRDWEQVANLKMTFDEAVAQLLAPADPRPHGRLLSLEEIQSALGPRSALLIAYVGEHSDGRAATYGVLVTREQVTAHGRVPDFESNELVMQDGERSTVFSAVGLHVASLRRALADEPGVGEVASQRAAQELNEALPRFFGALDDDLLALQAAGKDHLIVAPHDALHFAPFHLFDAKGALLADRFTVSYLPNLALLARSRERRNRQDERPVRGASIGLDFVGAAGGWQPLAEAVVEAKLVAEILGVTPLLNAQATKAAVIEALTRSTHVHVASHGCLDVDAPAFQMLVLHPPEDEASRLFAHEILDLDLSELDLVTLSACETALGRVDRSDNLRGLPAALFSAGVSTIVGTLWPVESDASEIFFTTFYSVLGEGRTQLEAFRAAQNETRDRFPAYRDWGSFYLAGAWD